MPRSRSMRRGLSNRESSPTSLSSEATRSRRRSTSRRCRSHPRGLAGNESTPSHRNLESGSAARARDLSRQRAVQAPPHLAVLAELVLVVVHLGPRLERGLRLRIELAGGRAAVETEARQDGLNLPHDVRFEEHDILRIFAGQQGEIVHVEDADQLLDRGRIVIDPDVDPTVVEARISTAVPDDEDRRALLDPFVTARQQPRAKRPEQSEGQDALWSME